MGSSSTTRMEAGRVAGLTAAAPTLVLMGDRMTTMVYDSFCNSGAANRIFLASSTMGVFLSWLVFWRKR